MDANVEQPISLTRLAYERLRSDVLATNLKPGQKLLMHELRERYSSGASPLREALSRLTTEGLVVHNEQRGFIVAEASPEGLRDLVRTRIAIEKSALAQAMGKPSPTWEENLVLAFHRLSRAPRSLDADHYEENPQWERLHRSFHLALLEGCESPLLIGFCEQLYDQAYRYRQLAARTAHGHRNELDEHRHIFDAVMAHRLDEAQLLLAEHYERTATLLSTTL